MFYSVDMLTRGGKFAVVWLAGSGQHLKDGKILAKHRRDALKVNVLKTVEDLQQCIIPNKDPNCPSKFSLYLAARLCHGTIAVHAFQVKHAVKNFCEQVYNRPRKLTKPGQALDCPTNTTAHNPNLKRCRCQKCATTLNYEEAEFGELIDNLVREETEGLRVLNHDGEQENIAPPELIQEWPEGDEFKLIQDLEEALNSAGTKVKDVNTITLPEKLDYIQDPQPTNEDVPYQPVESFVAEGEDHNMLTDYLDPKSLFHVAVLNGKLSGTETGALEEMEIENLVDTAPAKPPPSKGKRNGRGVTEVGGPSGPKKPKTVGEEGVPIDVPIPADPRQAEIEIEPVNEEQLPALSRRPKRKAPIVDEQTQLSVADLVAQKADYHDTMRVLDSFDDIPASQLVPGASANTLFSHSSKLGPTNGTLAKLITRNFNVPRNQRDEFDDDDDDVMEASDASDVFYDSLSPVRNVDDGPVPKSAQYAVPTANQSTGGSQSSTGSSGTSKRRRTAKTTCRKRLVSTIFEGPEDVDNNRAGEKRTEATKTTSGAAAADEDFYAWLDEFAGLNVSDSEQEEAVPEPEPQPDDLPELRVNDVIARIRELVEQHGEKNVTFTLLMPFASNNEHQAAQMFYFLLKLQRDGVVDLEQEIFEYQKEPGPIYIQLIEQN